MQRIDPSVLPARETPGSDVIVLWVRLGFEWQSPGLCFDCRGVKQYLINCQPLKGTGVPWEKSEFAAVHGGWFYRERTTCKGSERSCWELPLI